PFGNLIIEVTGDKKEIDKAYQYIKDEGILVQEVQING
ncbi:NIL domain-containing protein, partial [Peribacillus sp. NPDC060186]